MNTIDFENYFELLELDGISDYKINTRERAYDARMARIEDITMMIARKIKRTFLLALCALQIEGKIHLDIPRIEPKIPRPRVRYLLLNLF